MPFTEQELLDALGLNVSEAGAPEGAAAQGGQDSGAVTQVIAEISGVEAGGAGEGQEPGAGAVGVGAPDSGNTQEIAEKSTLEAEAEQDSGAAAAGEGAGSAGEAAVQTEEQRRQNADKRKRYEEAQAIREKAAVDKAVADAVAAERARAKSEMDEFFSGARLQNTFTNTPINSLEEFRSWRREYESAEISNDLAEGRLTPEALDRAIAGSPVMQRAQEVIRQGEESARRQQEAALQAKVDAELAEIGKLDPSVKGINDILAMPTGRAFHEAVMGGHSFLDAFKLANFERLRSDASAGAAAAARQQAVTNAGGKDHLQQTTSPRGGGSAPIPQDELALAKALMPDVPESKIREYYSKRRTGG